MAEEEDLEVWLKKIRRGDPKIISCSFPSDGLKSEYISAIEKRADDEVVYLIRKFLMPSGSLGLDQFTLRWLSHQIKKGELPRLSEFQKRLLIYAKSLASGRRDAPPPWEGITWVLDLLPYNPRGAISTLDAYFEAHCQFMPDWRIHGVADAMEIIRAKYIERPRSSDDAIRLLLNEPARTFEHLVERLYFKMGYATVLTPRQKDGGYDVLATKREPGRRAKLHVECKRWEGSVGEPILRGLLGVLSDTKATNGICVTTSDLSGPAKAFVSRNPRLDYISGPVLVKLMNEYLGPTWYYGIERLVRESKSSTGDPPPDSMT